MVICKDPLILARNIKTFSIECWDTNQMDWVTEWDLTNSIPPMIRVGLVFGGVGDASTPELSVIRAFSIPSSEMPSAVQMGAAGGPGGGGLPQFNPGKPH